jgi:acylphosphatase
MSSMSDKPAQITRGFIVRGRVQGVGFRWYVEREASLLGIIGWVRNNPDGAVEVLATGTRQQINALHEKLRMGPRAARVDDIQVFEGHPVQGLRTFRIEGAW